MGPLVGSKEKRRRPAKIRRKDAKINPKAENGTKNEKYAGKLEKGGVYNVGPRGWQQSGANGRQRGTREG